MRHTIEASAFQGYGLFEGEVASIARTGQDKDPLRYEVRTSIRNPVTLSARRAPDEKPVMVMKLDSQINTAERTLYDILADGLFGQR